MKDFFKGTEMKKSFKIILILGIITIVISMLPETCLAGDLIGRCITFIDQWELLLAVLSSVLIGSALCRDSPPDIKRGVTIAIAVFAFLVTQAAIAEYGTKFSLIYFPVMAVLSFVYFIKSLFGFAGSSVGRGEPGKSGEGGAQPAYKPPKEEKQKGKGSKFFAWIKWIFRIGLSGAVFIFVNSKFGWQIGLVAFIIALIFIIWITKKIQTAFIILLILIIFVTPLVTYLWWEVSPDSANEKLPAFMTEKIFPTAKQYVGDPIRKMLNKQVEEAVEGKAPLPGETIGGVKYSDVTSTAQARTQANQLTDAGRSAKDQAVKDQIRQRLINLKKNFPLAFK